MGEVDSKMKRSGVIPVIYLENPAQAAPLGAVLTDCGVQTVEITLRTPGAVKAIAQMRQTQPHLLVGAGTVVSLQQLSQVEAAGAQFVVSPGLDPVLVAACQARGLPIYPGAATATEFQAAYRLGLRTVKFFPAAYTGGTAAIQALHAPFPMMQVLPTGGITPENLRDYLQCPGVCACGASYMVRPAWIIQENWREIAAACQQTLQIVREVHENG